jgi:phospholipid/cholesterol/gamma-HCH transport system substrate-binding protein
MPVSKKVTVAVFLGGAFLLFTLGLFLIGDRRMLFDRSLELRTTYQGLAGLKVGSKVLVSGMDAGEVVAISVPGGPEGKFEVRFRVLEKFSPVLRSDSVATIEMDGLVGSKVLQVSAGTNQGRELQSGDMIPSREAVEFGDLIKEAVDTVRYARGSVDDVRQAIDSAVDTFLDLNKNAFELLRDVGGEAREITQTGRKIAGDIGEVVEGVKAGRGTVGKLVTDDRLYDRLRAVMQEVEATGANLREITDDAKTITEELKAVNLAANLDRTVENVREISEKGKQLLAGLTPDRDGEDGLSADLRQTMANANRAMADFAENMEALKRNWFFRGYFNQRGFFNLDAVSVADYQAGRFAPDRVRRHQWLHRTEILTSALDGTEGLTEQGRQKLDSAMAEFLRYARDNPIMIEGYASDGMPEEQFLKSLERAAKVRTYLLKRFPLNPNYVGVMPMGAVASSDPTGKAWDGIALVLYLPKDSERAGK